MIWSLPFHGCWQAPALCFLTISILGTDKPFKGMQPDIHPKLRIWQFHREKSGASGQKKKCQKGLPASLLIVNKQITTTSRRLSVGSSVGRKGENGSCWQGLLPWLQFSLSASIAACTFPKAGCCLNC